MYSTVHHAPGFKEGKPNVIGTYNSTKFAVDIYDEMVQRYAYDPKVLRWPLRLFMHLVDACALNSYVLFGGNISRREFIDRLSDQLMEDQINRRAETKAHWMNDTFKEIAGLYDRYNFSGLFLFSSLHKKRTGDQHKQPVRHCYICNKSGRGEKIRSCSRCEKLVCEMHKKDMVLCPQCQ